MGVLRHLSRPLAAALGALLMTAAGCGGGATPPPAPPGPAASSAPATVDAVGAESQYANVIAQVGGRYVHASSVENNPNTDPHSFEASPSVARKLASARLVVINGLGYDTWATKMLAATSGANRKVIDAQTLLGLPNSTLNPHLWYDPRTMPAVARAVAADLAEMMPAEASYFQANATRFADSLKPWTAALAAFKAKYGGTPVAVTEPVGDYLLEAAGCTIKTPFSLQAAVMNGTDPAPQDVTLQQNLFRAHRVAALAYNQQVTSPLTQSFLNLAKQEGIPIVAVYETMPAGYTYQNWMLAETNALERAVADHTSTTRL